MIKQKENGFYIGDINKTDAEITFIETDIITVDHTYVSESLRGQGIAWDLLSKVIEYSKQKKKKILPICSYAKVKLSDEKYKEIVVNK